MKHFNATLHFLISNGSQGKKKIFCAEERRKERKRERKSERMKERKNA